MPADLVRLLKFIGNSDCLLETTGEADEVPLRRPDGRCLAVSRTALAEAARRGLIEGRAGAIRCRSEARAFLRRQLAARTEAFLDQHRDVGTAAIGTGADRLTVRINRAESPLAQLGRLKGRDGTPWFSPEEIAAGERLARDFQFAGLQPRVTQTYEPRISDRPSDRSGHGQELSDSVVAARLRVARALQAVGPELSGVALDVCCFEKGLEMVERERSWPARSAKLMLRAALAQLHRHYNPPVPEKRRRHAWGAQGFRPEL